jgi:4-alpha-glucanotransferase
MKTRGSGVLLHITSLPSRFGIGDLGPAAYRFADLLAGAGQRYWQILPLNATDPAHDSDPYHALSALAQNPLLVSPELLAADGLLDHADLALVPSFPDDRVDFDRVVPFRERLLDSAYSRFAREGDRREFERFCTGNAWWLDDFALFIAIRSDRGGLPWSEWPEELRRRDPEALLDEARRLEERTNRARFGQFLFDRQWRRLHDYCRERGISIIGDMPIYVDYDSVDVWRHPEYFQLDDDLRPTVISGVPPDHFSAAVQVWHHPLYRWDVLQRTGFAWWTARMERALACVDYVRIDHFRGLVAYWEIPAAAPTVFGGRWVPAPADALLAELARRFPHLPVIAEDLGIITPDVREIMQEFGIPGMRVLLFAFDTGPERNPHLPHNVVRNCVVYTGTHDTSPVRGWIEDGATEAQRSRVREYFGRDIPAGDFHWVLIRLAMSTVADTVIVPVQDLLGLGTEARVNLPGTHHGNWRWRLTDGMLTSTVLERLHAMTETFERGRTRVPLARPTMTLPPDQD